MEIASVAERDRIYDEPCSGEEGDYDNMLTSSATTDESRDINYWKSYFGFPVTPPRSPDSKETTARDIKSFVCRDLLFECCLYFF